jgi:hypothetical protein
MIYEFSDTHFPGTAGATKGLLPLFKPMTNNACPATFAQGSKLLNGTFKAVKGVLVSTDKDFECFSITVSAIFTTFHDDLLALAYRQSCN